MVELLLPTNLEKVKSKISVFSKMLEDEGQKVREALSEKNYPLLEKELHKEKCTAKVLRKLLDLERRSRNTK